MIVESAGELMHARQWESNLDLVLGQGHVHEIKKAGDQPPLRGRRRRARLRAACSSLIDNSAGLS
jgi:hypothetical protein